jgi:cytochrome c oxidase cbb3-type subunit 4
MIANIHAWWTVLLLATFIGIVLWAFQSTRRDDFDEAARLPLDDEGPQAQTPARKGGKSGG